MTALYVFSLAVGGPLLLWFAFAGDAEGDGFGGDADGSGPLSVIPLSSFAFVLAFFGLAGLVSEWTGAGAVFAAVLAVVVGLTAGILNSAAFRWLRRNSNSSNVTARDLEGSIARVSLPISTEHRGKIVLSVAGAREQMTASSADGSSLTKDQRVVVVRVEQGVALVAPLGPALEID